MRVEVFAQWKHPKTGEKYESSIGSVAISDLDLTIMEEVGSRVCSLVVDAIGYEMGPITDFAVNVERRCGECRRSIVTK